MKVVWVSPSVPHPEAAGGWSHEFELIKGLAPHHEIEVISADLDGQLDDGPLGDLGVAFTRVPWRYRPHPTGRLRVGLLVPLARPNVDLWLKRDRIGALARAIDAARRRLSPDLVHITTGELAPLIGGLAEPSGVLLYDSLTREIERRLEVETLPRRRAQLRVERRRTEAYERRWYGRATGIISVSPDDATRFEKLVGRPVEVIEVPVADRFFDPPERARTDNVVTFVGTLNHRPNTDAVEWLATEIWPLVTATRPDARLVVVGRGDPAGVTTAAVRALVEGVGGRVDTDVDDIRPYYWEAAVAVAPMRLGSGMRNKVIHAMACGALTVATPAAMEGVPAAAARHATVRSSAGELAGAILDALADREAAGRQAAAAAEGITELRAGDVAERMDRWWQGLVSGG